MKGIISRRCGGFDLEGIPLAGGRSEGRDAVKGCRSCQRRANNGYGNTTMNMDAARNPRGM
jgi:hypothetical protein